MAKREFIDKQDAINHIFYATDNNGEVVLGKQLRERIEHRPTFTEQDIAKSYLDKIKSYTDHLRNCGMGKSKSLDFMDKFVDGLLSEQGKGI